MQLRKFSLCRLLGFLTILISQSVVAYEPKSLMDSDVPKYKTGTINDSGFYYNYWMPTMASNYGSVAAVRESFAPSVMVDTNGDLYAITLYGFSSKDGPTFAIHKYVNGSYSTRKTFYPWTKIPGVTPNCTDTPAFDHGIAVGADYEKELFKNYIHNAFSPCLAQEVNGSSDYIYGFIYIPTTRLMNIEVTTSQYSGAENGGTEGMLFFKIKKDKLLDLTTNYIPHTKCRAFAYNRLPVRCIIKDWKEAYLQPCYGNLRACYNNGNVYLYSFANLISNDLEHYDIYCSNFSQTGIYNGCILVAETMFNALFYPKFMPCGNYFYFMCNRDGYVPKLFMQSISNNSIYEKINSLWAYIYLDDEGGWTYSRYNFDFLVLDSKDEKSKIWCILGFQGQNSYSGLSETQGWSSTYCNFSYSNASLFIWSFPITNGTVSYTIEDPIQKNLDTKFDTIDKASETGCTYAAYPEYIQNVIYTTECGSNSAIRPQESGDINKRLYLNTQKMCVYKNYIIYAYCYPGKTGKGNHLYIGYAPYVITSNAQLRLLTKTEFKDADDNSFITDCSRIISLDCKNGHVWLTYMASDNTQYKYFYIKASDLVGE